VKLAHLVGFITKKFVTMHGHMNVNIYIYIYIYNKFQTQPICVPHPYIKGISKLINVVDQQMHTGLICLLCIIHIKV